MTFLDVDSVCRDFMVRGFFGRRTGFLRALDSVSFQVSEAEAFGIVGETGSGKSTLGKIIAGIQRPTAGRVSLEGKTIASHSMMPGRTGRATLQYVYQDPGASLDPRWTIRRSLHEPLVIHTNLPRHERDAKIHGMLAALELPSTLLDRFPREISGGQQRRVGLARVLLLAPKIVIFDEPTSGLDTLVRSSVLRLLENLRKEFRLTYLMISHDINVVSSICDRVAVMHQGRVVELGRVNELMLNPVHPYSRSLIMASPRIGGVRLTDDPEVHGGSIREQRPSPTR